ncbi:MAG: YeeE/YedE family protein [Myxococcaceae bacterium]|nr:YeeE/YedE family protein [Myxococcaceae bacterium]
MNLLSACLSGALFAVGLVLSGMTEPARIVRFLDVAGEWDPALAFVMAGAVLTYAPFYYVVTRMRRPLLEAEFHVPPRGPLDGKLFAGAAMFGVGWGLAGLCPGPALVALGAGKLEAALFCLAMVAGSLGAAWFSKVSRPTARASQPVLAHDDA